MKQLNTIRWMLIGIVAFALVGCKLESLQDPIIVTNVEKEFYINLWEELYPNTRNLRIDLQSIKNQDCLNYTIDYKWNATSNQFDLEINDITPPADCLPGIGPANAKIGVGDLENQFFKMKIGLGETVINEGQLLVNSESYTLQMDSEEGIIIPEKVLRRVPGNSVWGFVAFQNGEDQAIASDLLGQLSTLGDPIALKEGKYGYFSFLDSKLLVSGAPETGQVSSFIIEYEGDQKAIQEVVDNFRASHSGSVTLKVLTASGDIY
ncbi:MAG: hypothetical protein KTR30_38200 [Saprospiraceae bacterium]|nr:hypothetical protein [Saprospiraceae bacterium]